MGRRSCALTVVFVESAAIRRLNRRYRKLDYPTDVLSFRYGCHEEDGLQHLGDIIIAPEIASANARRWRVSEDREIRKLVIHGVLHLLGYDHEIDSGEMNQLQARLLRRRFFHASAPVLQAVRERRRA